MDEKFDLNAWLDWTEERDGCFATQDHTSFVSPKVVVAAIREAIANAAADAASEDETDFAKEIHGLRSTLEDFGARLCALETDRPQHAPGLPDKAPLEFRADKLSHHLFSGPIDFEDGVARFADTLNVQPDDKTSDAIAAIDAAVSRVEQIGVAPEIDAAIGQLTKARSFIEVFQKHNNRQRRSGE